MKLGYNDPDYALEEAAPMRKSSTPAPAAPPPPNAFTYKPPSLGGYDEYMEAQRVAFNPQFVGTRTGGGALEGEAPPSWDEYTQYDPMASQKNYMGQLYSELGVSPELGNMFEQIYGYRGAKESLAKSIGYTGRTGVQGPDVSGGTNEGGYEGFTPSEVISPEFAQALAQYSYKPSIQGNDPAVTVYKPSGEEVGQFRIGDSPSFLDKYGKALVLGAITGGAGFALAPAALGLVGLGGAAGAGGLSAATLNAMAAGTIGSTLNTAVQGGNAQDYLRGIATAAAMPVINSALTKLPGISSGVNYASKAVEDALQGAPQSFINTAAALPQNIVQGAARGLITGDVFGGISDAVLGQITQDVAPSLGLTEPQARALAKWGRDQDTNALVMSLGSGLAKQAMGSVQDAIKQQGIEQAYNDPSRALDVLPEEARAYTPETYDPNAPVTGGTDFDLNALLSTLPYEVQNSALGVDLGQPEPTPELPQVNITGPKAGTPEYDSTYYGDYGGFAEPTPELPQVNITGQKPVDAGFDLDALLSTLPYEVQNSALGVDLGQPEPVQQAVIRGERPPEDDLLDLIGIGGGYGGNPPPISPGQTPQQIAITEKKPVVEDELDLPPYKYTIPELPLLEPPKVEIEKPTAPPLGGGPTTPTTPSKGIDINSLLNLLGGGGQEPVLSQVLAQMPGFDVESMSQYMREQRRKKAPDQQTQLAELFANIGYRG